VAESWLSLILARIRWFADADLPPEVVLSTGDFGATEFLMLRIRFLLALCA